MYLPGDHGDHSDRIAQFKEKLAHAWNVLPENLRMPTSKMSSLEEWMTPREISRDAGHTTLNWAAWISNEDIHKQADYLKLLLGDDPSFFMWKHVGHQQGALDPLCSRVNAQNASAQRSECEDVLKDVRLNAMLRDEYAPKGPRRPLFADGPATRSRLFDSEEVYVLRNADGKDIEAMILLCDVQRAYSRRFQYPERAASAVLDKQIRVSAGEVVFIDVIVSDRCGDVHAASRILKHVFALHPNSLCVVHCPAVLSTMKFYKSMGFCYNDMREDSKDMLSAVIYYAAQAVAAWHSGSPAFTYVDSLVEDRQVRLSHYSSEIIASHSLEGLKAYAPRHVRHLYVRDAKDVERISDVLGAPNPSHDNFWIWMPVGWQHGASQMFLELVDEAQKVLSENDAIDSITIVSHEQDVKMVITEARKIPVPTSTARHLGTPVHEGAGLGGGEGEDHEPSHEPSHGPHHVSDGERPSDSNNYFYGNDNTLDRTRVSDLLRRLIPEEGFSILEMAQVHRALFYRIFNDELILRDSTLFGTMMKKNTLDKPDSPVYACVYRKGGKETEVVHFNCPGNGRDLHFRMFALFLKVDCPSDRMRLTGHIRCEPMRSILELETKEVLFETCISHRQRTALIER